MKRRREMIQGLSLSQNFRLIMTEQGLSFRDLAKKARVSQATCYRLVERSPVFVTDQLVKFGKCLGFTERQVREKSRQDRLASKVTYSKKERLYQAITKIIDLFDAK
jgi:predicted transcriptional regulator